MKGDVPVWFLDAADVRPHADLTRGTRADPGRVCRRGPQRGADMTTVKQILATKGSDVWSIHPELSVFEALEYMAEKDIGALLVVEDGEIVGIFSERDYARKIVLRGLTSRGTPVSELMTRRVFSVDPDRPIEDCMAIMTQQKIRHLPVCEGGDVVGVISIGDVVKGLIADREHLIHDLEAYICGR